MYLAFSFSVVMSSVAALLMGFKLLKTSDEDLLIWRSQGYRRRFIYAPGLKTKARLLGFLLVLLSIVIVLSYLLLGNG